MPVQTWTFLGTGLVPAMNVEDAVMIAVRLKPSTTFPLGCVIGELLGTNERQSIAITGGPTGGTFTLTFGGQTTAAIPWNASAYDVLVALQALTSIGIGNVAVSGGVLPGDTLFVDFVGALAATNVAQMTHTDSLTGGASPAVVIATVTQGAAGTPGVWAPYLATNADGSQFPKLLLQYPCLTDAAGLITFGTSVNTGQEFGQKDLTAPAYRVGIFNIQDLPTVAANPAGGGFDQNAANQMGRLIEGSVQAGAGFFALTGA